MKTSAVVCHRAYGSGDPCRGQELKRSLSIPYPRNPDLLV